MLNSYDVGSSQWVSRMQRSYPQELISILVMWMDCRFLDAEVDGSNPGISMSCPCARHFIRIGSVDSAVK